MNDKIFLDTNVLVYLHVKYQYRYWDSLVIATALLNGCDILYSEDLHEGQLIEDKLTIINPF